MEREIAMAKRASAHTQIGLIRVRSMEICVALQQLQLSAHELMAIVEFACEPFVHCVRLGAKWNIVVCVKHFNERQVTRDN